MHFVGIVGVKDGNAGVCLVGRWKVLNYERCRLVPYALY